MTGFTYGGVENISKDKSYMYVSNHRDIVLDASLLQQILSYNGFDTTQITLGANLMENPVVTDVFKSNKMFSDRAQRSGGGRAAGHVTAGRTGLGRWAGPALGFRQRSLLPLRAAPSAFPQL